MKKTDLKRYIGRIVCLKDDVFQEIKRKARDNGLAPENAFLVAEVHQQLKQLICYGNRSRVVVSLTDVVLV